MLDDRLKRELKKRRLIRLVIFLCLCLIPALTYLETRVFQLGPLEFPVSGNVLVFMLININIILLLLIVFLVLRNLTRLVFERRQLLLGARLRTKLVISFVSLSLIPTGLLFFIALQFVSTSMDYWFNINVEQSLMESLTLARSVYQESRDQINRIGAVAAGDLESISNRQAGPESFSAFLATTRELHAVAGLELVSEQRHRLAANYDPILERQGIPDIPAEFLRRALAGEKKLDTIQPVAAGELVRGLTLVHVAGEPETRYVLIVSRLIPGQKLQAMATISSGLEGYRRLMLLKSPIKTSLLVMLLIVTLLIVFAAIWFGFYVAAGLTGPISKLAMATKRVAEGELDFVIEKDSGDEMGTLVDSFNLMTRDLAAGKHELEMAYQALQESNRELEERRRYIEIILQNVTAGVISLDDDGRIITINRFAEELLHIDKKSMLNRQYRSVLRWAHISILEESLQELKSSGKPAIQRPIRLTIGDETFSLRINFVRLSDDEGRPLGVVLVFDNLTEIEKMQRMAAWREVARRIAHEVKNPLTPIQLSAQRLRKKYLDRLGPDGEAFDKCTQTIINQVDELKRLVSEFSSFARMPAVQKSLNSLFEMSKECMVLYQQAHKEITFTLQGGEDMELFSFDLKQLKRVLINLLDNAVAVLPDGGLIEIALSSDREQKLAFLEVRDNGPGIKEEDNLRLFEPYFSTKKSGTGLGLAIASTVVADHGGYIRVKNNEPQGARFIVELPMAEKK